MERISLGVKNVEVALVSDENYYDSARSIIQESEHQCLCSLFILDLSPDVDLELKVHNLLLELQQAHWRGVDVKVVIGGSRSNFEIAKISHSAYNFIRESSLPCKLLMSEDVRGSHMKFVCTDSKVLSGSHNWSFGAFGGQIQDSILINSENMVSYINTLFYGQWKRTIEMP